MNSNNTQTLEIFWQGCQLDEAVLHLEIGQELVYHNTSLQKHIAAELEELLSRLFDKAQTIIVEAMVRGYSGTGVLKVQPFYLDRGGGCKVVVKFGDVSLIEQEYINFMKYTRGFLEEGCKTMFLNYQHTEHLGGIVCSLLGTTIDQVQDFGIFYHLNGASQVKEVLDQLFRSTCGAWYMSHQQCWPRNLTADYQQLLRCTPEQIELKISENLKTVEGKERLFFRSLRARNKHFTNPLQVLARTQSFVRPTYTCTTHGDFNQHNILIGSNKRAWLIDFQKTGQGHILRDVAMLDTTIRFQLLRAEGATLDERFTLEDTLCHIKRFSQIEQLPASLSTENQSLAKAYEVIVHLRKLAQWMVDKNPADDISEYHIALLYNALNITRFSTLEMVQREHALLSACMLIDNLV